MIFEKDVPLEAGDGSILRANVYRPREPGRYPVLMAMGIYGKDVHFADGYRLQWDTLKKIHPAIDTDGSTGQHLRWELVDPERWVPEGFVVVAVDSRGSGKSPGYLDPFSPRETQDFYDAIEWAAAQPWSSGKVGTIGISYYAIKQWQVASLRPPHLCAVCVWEGGSDLYRDWSHHGGIFSHLFPTAWYPRQVLPNQNGNAGTHYRERDTGKPNTGEPLSTGILAGNRADHPRDLLEHPLDDAWYRTRSPNLPRIEVPLLSAGNWGGAGLHLRGNIEGYMRAGSKRKWLQLHVGTHFESFYLPQFIERQKRFFAYFLKGEDNGWANEAPVRLFVRRPDGGAFRDEAEWPLSRTKWTSIYLDAEDKSLRMTAPARYARLSYRSLGEGVSFSTAPFEQETEFTGPAKLRLWASSSTTDLDVFATLRLFDPKGEEVVFTGASDLSPVARGWLRASHRKQDPVMSLPYRPYHSHDEIQKLAPNEVYALDVEIWPTSIVCPPGYRLVLTIQGRDFEARNVPGRILHDSEADRPRAEFDSLCSIHCGPEHDSHLLLPLIPA
ncbi:MAG: CocE/NonD family hydrolase [Alphaproteobacteria bacterium]|nr:CocE/NonD family hydrolase [Alphaproteobacteria bacterium]